MEHQVKSYKRRTKSGKVITVRAHSRKGKDGASSGIRGRVRPKRHMSDELYYRKYKKDIDDMMEQGGGSLKDNILQHKNYMKNVFPHEKDILDVDRSKYNRKTRTFRRKP